MRCRTCARWLRFYGILHSPRLKLWTKYEICDTCHKYYLMNEAGHCFRVEPSVLPSGKPYEPIVAKGNASSTLEHDQRPRKRRRTDLDESISSQESPQGQGSV